MIDMKLRVIVSIQEETEKQLDQYANTYQVITLENKEQLCAMLGASSTLCEELLLVAATDDTIRIGSSFHVATLGYRNTKIRGQSLGGVEYLVEGFEELEAGYLEKVYQRYHRIPWTIASTSRCVIRELCMEDMDALYELYSDKSLTRYTEDLLGYEEETIYQRAYINNMYRYYGYGMWLVFSKDTGELIGRAGLEHRALRKKVAVNEKVNGDPEEDMDVVIELGYLIKTKYQHQGLAKEICQAILNYAKEELEIEQLNCFIEEGNTSSMKLAKSLGFSYQETVVEQNRNMLRFIRKSHIIKH